MCARRSISCILDLRLQASKWKSCQEKVGQRVVWDQSDLAFSGSASWWSIVQRVEHTRTKSGLGSGLPMGRGAQLERARRASAMKQPQS